MVLGGFGMQLDPQVALFLEPAKGLMGASTITVFQCIVYEACRKRYMRLI